MNSDINEIEQRINNLSDDELIKMIEIDINNYTDEAITIAKSIIEKRGGYEELKRRTYTSNTKTESINKVNVPKESKITIFCPMRFQAGTWGLRVYIDGKLEGKIRIGKTKSFMVSSGEHEVLVKIPMAKAIPINFSIDNGEEIKFTQKVIKGGMFHIFYLHCDNKKNINIKIPEGNSTKFAKHIIIGLIIALVGIFATAIAEHTIFIGAIVFGGLEFLFGLLGWISASSERKQINKIVKK